MEKAVTDDVIDIFTSEDVFTSGKYVTGLFSRKTLASI